MKCKISTALLSGLTFGFALPAGAVSPHSEWFADRVNTFGTTVVVTSASTRNQFCYLSRVFIEETDTGGESAACQVRRNFTADRWVLEATLGRSSDADARCRAICYNN